MSDTSRKAYRGRIVVEVVSYGINAVDAKENAGTLLDWADQGTGWALNTETGHWPVSQWESWQTVGRFVRAPEHDRDDS